MGVRDVVHAAAKSRCTHSLAVDLVVADALLFHYCQDFPRICQQKQVSSPKKKETCDAETQKLTRCALRSRPHTRPQDEERVRCNLQALRPIDFKADNDYLLKQISQLQMRG